MINFQNRNQWISDIAVHQSGDHVLVGDFSTRLAWIDMGKFRIKNLRKKVSSKIAIFDQNQLKKTKKNTLFYFKTLYSQRSEKDFKTLFVPNILDNLEKYKKTNVKNFQFRRHLVSNQETTLIVGRFSLDENFWLKYISALNPISIKIKNICEYFPSYPFAFKTK